MCVIGYCLMRVIKWSVMLDVATLAARIRLVVSRLLLVAVLPLDFHGGLRVVRSMFVPGALRGVEASLLGQSSLLKLRAAVLNAVWSHRQPLANAGAVWSLLDGLDGFDPGYCPGPVWFRFRMLRRYLAYKSL